MCINDEYGLSCTLIFITAAGEARMPLAHGFSTQPAVCMEIVLIMKTIAVRPDTTMTTKCGVSKHMTEVKKKCVMGVDVYLQANANIR
jgi:hypothetical protein